MKKFVFFIFSIIFIIPHAEAQIATLVLGLKGKVKKSEEHTFHNDENNNLPEIMFTYTFDTIGNVLTTEQKNSLGEILYESQNTIDNGYIIEIRYTTSDLSSNPIKIS